MTDLVKVWESLGIVMKIARSCIHLAYGTNFPSWLNKDAMVYVVREIRAPPRPIRYN
jgi:hypothetical protein